ncbi:MAG TPA: transglutaminase-like domain-containing protein, partial [Acidimicrobiales bacterium]
NKRGYCEQFAGAFAVMARSVGLPARVAVGFTPGELGADGRYHVRGLNAHAWPEVYIEGFGWTYFEPTPGRGMPGSQEWTGVPPQQAPPGSPNSAATIPTTTAPPAPDDNTPTTAPRPEDDSSSVGTGDEAPKPSKLDNPLVHTGLLVLVLALAWVVGVPSLKRARRNRRRAAATDPAGRVLVAWAEAEDALAAAGVARRRSETIDEFATRAPGAASLGSGPAEALQRLAADAVVANYAGEAPESDAVSRAMAAAVVVEQALKQAASTRQRVLRTLDPRPLLPEGDLREQLTLRRRRAPEPA